MREIKFRAWNGTAMSRPFQLGSVRMYWNSPHRTRHSDMPIYALQGEGISVMQYTGLKDRNGVEIYEGDVVEHVRSHNRFRIIFDKSGRFGCEYQGSAVPSDVPEAWTVIGNVYEHPELLETSGNPTTTETRCQTSQAGE